MKTQKYKMMMDEYNDFYEETFEDGLNEFNEEQPLPEIEMPEMDMPDVEGPDYDPGNEIDSDLFIDPEFI
jgi:hypothetical protein